MERMHQHALIMDTEMNNEFRLSLNSTARSYPSATNRVIKIQYVERLYIVRPVRIPFGPGELDRLNLNFGVREEDDLVIQQISIFGEMIFETDLSTQLQQHLLPLMTENRIHVGGRVFKPQ
jgi:hypothetical protein